MSNCIILSGGTWSPDNFTKVKRSLGPYRLSSSLEDAGYTTFVLDFANEFTSDEIIKVLSKHLTDDTLWIGFSSTFYWPQKKYDGLELNSNLSEMYYCSDYNEIKKIIDYVHQNSMAKIVYGGAKAAFYSFVDVDEHIDYYVTGNADVSIINLTDYLSGKADTIQHITGKIIESTKYKEPEIEKITTRWWKKEYNVLPNEGLPIELARGCIFKCKFCDYPLTGKKKGTYLRDTEQIKDEMIRTWESHGTDSYFFTDDTFNDDNDKLENLHKMFGELPFKPKFASYLRIDLLNKFPHQADLLEEMGIVGTFFGLETLQPDSAKSIGKGLNPNKVKDRLYWLHEKWNEKVNIEAGFILGLPHDRLSYFNELLNWSLENDNPLQAIRFYPLMLFNSKGTNFGGSEFSINSEIYGYEFGESHSNWILPQQKLSYRLCSDVTTKFTELRTPRNKISGFQVITALNSGINLYDIYKMSEEEVVAKYNIPELNKQKFGDYKRMVGL